ncbi:MAG: hypothetical protein KC656_16240 [Myxococcales bacterium]|nr:hypothetical protein [Myxococcales bacterium]MCB9672135.1 hypothetical protein [Alphaproteobacteria bacterium]MCB9691588.1 hypothetical protein [Alphaproteobacteria bacterium]
MLLLTTAALAGDIAWSWDEGVQHRYHIVNKVELSEVFWMRSETNEERRAIGWTSEWDLLCTGKGPESKKTFLVSCQIDQLRIEAVPNAQSDIGDLQGILDEWDDRLVGASVNLTVHGSGHITDIELEDVKRDHQNDRSREMVVSMRMFVERAVAGLEVSLPKNGEPVEGGWPAKVPRLLSVPSSVGTVGGADVISKLTEQKGDLVTIETAYEGVRGPAVDTDADGRSANGVNLWAMKGFSRWQLNTRVGVVTRVETLCEGTLTPSSALAIQAAPSPYIQAITVQRRGPANPLEPFGPNTVMKRE